MNGLSNAKTRLTLETNQNLNIPVSLAVGSAAQTLEVTSQAPLLDTADTRLQKTLSTQTLSSLPLAGRSMISLVTLAPGVTGTGVTSNGSPGSGRDNFSTETQVDASANGQGAVGNMYIVDGLDVSSSMRPGVLNMTPNPDSIQEATIQTDTYNIYAESLSEAAQGDPAMLAQASAAASRAVQLEPDYQPARDLLCTLLLRQNDLEAVLLQADEALRRDPFEEVAIYQAMLAQHKLKHEEKSAALVKQLQTARAHNQQGRIKYLLEEGH